MEYLQIGIDLVFLVGAALLAWYAIHILEHSWCDGCGKDFGKDDEVNVVHGEAYCDRCWRRIRQMPEG